MRRSVKGGGFQLIGVIGLPLFLVSWIPTWLYFLGFLTWWQTHRWTEVPCWIESAELKTEQRDDATAYSAIISYRYEFSGKPYQGRNVFLAPGIEDTGFAHLAAYNELAPYVTKDMSSPEARPFRCYVDPTRPQEAVIYRNLQMDIQAICAFFALTFTPLGLIWLTVGVFLGKRLLSEEKLRRAHPQEPWKWKAAWNLPVIPETRTLWRAILVAYTLWSGIIIWPLILAAVATRWLGSSQLTWLILILPVLWCIAAWFSYRNVRRWLMGPLRFEPAEIPILTAGPLRGDLLFRKQLPVTTSAIVEISCTEIRTVTTGQLRAISKTKIWNHEETVSQDHVISDHTGFRLPVSFILPADAPPVTFSEKGSIKHVWNLKFRIPGAGLSANFDLPVAPRQDHCGTHVPFMIETAEAVLQQSLSKIRTELHLDAQGMPRSILCLPARNRYLSLGLFILEVIWTTLGIILLRGYDALILFIVLWPLFAAGIWFGFIYSLLHRREVTFSNDGLEVVNQIGLIKWTRALAKSQIANFGHTVTFTRGDYILRRVEVEGFHSQKVTLVDSLPSMTTVAALEKKLDDWKNRQ